MRRILLFLIINLSISGCAVSLGDERPVLFQKINFSTVKKVIIKRLSFLPYINYVPDIEPKESGLILLGELQKYETIVDDHIVYDLAKEIEMYPNEKSKLRFLNFIRKKKKSDSIEEKVLDIEKIRALTSRYENWSVSWDEKANLVGERISIDEVDLIKSEIKRISKKL